jgi:hypothetical protein
MKHTPTDTPNPPSPTPIGVTFAVEHLEDSPVNYVLLTLDPDDPTGNTGSVGIDMRVTGVEVLQAMITRFLEAVEPTLRRPQKK